MTIDQVRYNCIMTTENISAAELRRLIDYDPETGRFTSRVRRGRIAVGDVVGTRRNDGYVKIGIGGRQYYAHRLAWLHVYGEYPSVVDHVDRNPSNNRLTNLRLVNLSQNQQNQVAHINNTSGYKGVTLHKKSGLWKAEIQVNRRRTTIGYYKTPDQASVAYQTAAMIFHSHRPGA